MYTQCPECRTIFRVHEPQLEAAGGRVRCGQCMHVFKAPDHQVDALPETAEGPADAPRDTGTAGETPETAAGLEPPEGPGDFSGHDEPSRDEATVAGAGPEPEPPPASAGPLEEELDESHIETLLSGDEPAAPEPVASPEPPTPPPPEPVTPLPDEDAPPPAAAGEPPEPPDEADETFIEELRGASTERPTRGATAVWSLLVLLLVAGLVGQYAYMNRQELAREPLLRPWLERLCQVADCELPPRRDLAAIEVFDPQIQSHPRFRDALLLSATLTNGAEFAQPYPLVEVALKDLGGNRVAWRRFAPEDYLVESDHDRFPAGSEAHLLLEVTDPGEEAVGFEFNIVGGR